MNQNDLKRLQKEDYILEYFRKRALINFGAGIVLLTASVILYIVLSINKLWNDITATFSFIVPVFLLTIYYFSFGIFYLRAKPVTENTINLSGDYSKIPFINTGLVRLNSRGNPLPKSKEGFVIIPDAHSTDRVPLEYTLTVADGIRITGLPFNTFFPIFRYNLYYPNSRSNGIPDAFNILKTAFIIIGVITLFTAITATSTISNIQEKITFTPDQYRNLSENIEKKPVSVSSFAELNHLNARAPLSVHFENMIIFGESKGDCRILEYTEKNIAAYSRVSETIRARIQALKQYKDRKSQYTTDFFATISILNYNPDYSEAKKYLLILTNELSELL